MDAEFQPFGALCGSRAHTELFLAKEPVQNFLETEKARYSAIWKAVMIGYLCLKINRIGFGVMEEEALQKLGGKPDGFKAALNTEFNCRYNQDALQLRVLSDGKGREDDTGRLTAEFLAKNGLLISERDGTITYENRPSLALRIFGKKPNYIDLSSRFAGLSEKAVEGCLLSCTPQVRSEILSQIKESHNAMIEGEAAFGERQILPEFWASTVREYIALYANYCLEHLEHADRPPRPLNRLDLSNLDLHKANLRNREIAECRLDRTDLSDACCVETDFRGSRFPDANLSGAMLHQTKIAGCDLSTAILSNVWWSKEKPPVVNGYTKLLPDNWSPKNNEDREQQLPRFEGWTEEMFETLLANRGKNILSPTQRRSLNKLKTLLLNPKQSPIPLATSAEISTITSAIGTTSEEAQKALSRISRLTDSAGIPVLRDHDFSNKDLTNRPLRGAFIERASLNGASLVGKDLRGAVISNSDLRGANLKGADLSGALLVNVDLTGADLSEVDLTETNFINCIIDGVKLDRVKMINTEMQQSTFANVTITEGIIEDLIVCQSYLHDINFEGSAEGSGVLVSGLALVDSVGLNLQFSGNTELTQLQLMGSLGLGSGADEAELIIQGSEWRDQLVQVVTDPDLGVLEHGLEVTRVRTRNTNSPNRPLRRNGPDQTSTAFLVRMLVSRGGDLMGSYPILEHLERLTIGYQAGEVQRDEKNQISPQLILPARFTRGQ
jgi:uncharacterized protein YjbI with pentapeptide repeats